MAEFCAEKARPMNLDEIRLTLLRRARRPGRFCALLAGAALKVAPRGSGDMNVDLWGRRFRLPADHHLPFIVRSNPLCFMPLVHCAASLVDSGLTVVDVGANNGDTAALLESYLPGRCKFVCVEPNAEWLPYLRANTSGLSAEIIHRFIGEGQLLEISSRDPGTAGSRVTEHGEQSISLDEICDGRKVDLIKIDTDGFEFPILRSGRAVLSRCPALFFEWLPALWKEQGEDPAAIFDWLAGFGYKDFCFFSDGGFFYCRTTYNQPETIRSLVAAAECRRGIETLSWDVFAASPGV